MARPLHRRWWPVGLALACLASLAAAVSAAAQTKPDTRDLEVAPIDIDARPIAGFDRARPGRKRFGRLEWRGGLALSSPADAFGGWSGLAIDPDGRSFVAVSDAGTWLTAQITYDGAAPKGVALAKLGPILAVGGNSLKRNRDRDAEAVTLVDGSLQGGSLLVSFEQNQRIGRFEIGARGLSAPKSYLEMPPELQRKRNGDGLEALAVLKGGPMTGAVVAIAENLASSQGRHLGWIWQSGKPQRFQLSDIGGFSITDAAALPDGSLVVLERRFRWLEGVKMRLRLVAARDIRPGAVIEGETLLEADLSYEIDNMEGLAAHTGPRGETVLTLISDDNFNSFLQRTVLLQFVLHAESDTAAR